VPASATPADADVASLSFDLVQVAASLELPVPEALIAPLVRTEHDARDLAWFAVDRLGPLLGAGATPDLAVLTTDPVALTKSSGFGWRDDPFRHTRRYHRGTDFRARSGTPVLAAGDGVVVFAGRQRGYGKVIYIDHGGGLITRYAHLRRIEIHRRDAVTAGTRIGQVGKTGRATGPHLHFEVRLDGRAVDPVTAMQVARLEREAPLAGRLATLALTPAIQSRVGITVDHHRPARAHHERHHHHRHSRHERHHHRHHHHKRPKALS
jgi:murein DD-endopeptidase MepM/ murein hydrolase activator NlpD